MANEAAIQTLLGNGGDPLRFTVVDADAIQKGTLLMISGGGVMTAAASTSTHDEVFAGIATMEKVANDGSTTISAYTNCVADLVASGTFKRGDMVKLSGANVVSICTYNELISGGSVVGKALEAGTNGAATLVRVLV